jgi:hypothetical protein
MKITAKKPQKTPVLGLAGIHLSGMKIVSAVPDFVVD